jgi:hypothetical protein
MDSKKMALVVSPTVPDERHNAARQFLLSLFTGIHPLSQKLKSVMRR